MRKRVLAGQKAVGDRDLSASRDAKLLAKDVAMRLRGSRRDAESLADFLVRIASSDKFDDLALPLGDAR